MCKGQKSELGKLIKSPVKETLFTGHHVVVDGGYFLYSGEWTKNLTFGEICQAYHNHLHELKSYVTVVFDGYDATSSSTKTHEQQRRAKGSASKSYLFDENMKLQVKKNAFLSNYDNKNRLITMLKHLLVSHNKQKLMQIIW